VNILFLTSGHNGLSQRLLIELTDRGHQVVVTLATSDDAMLKSVDQNEPDLIVAPMLKVAIPEAIYSKHTCLILLHHKFRLRLGGKRRTQHWQR
jgi:putative two-component system protein, hydrogenase maturation factor HypX/HoxX